MQMKCDYCGRFIDDTDSVCPYCGGTNSHLKRAANNVPATIEELKAFCASHHLPLSQMRFFIGENYTGARAYGIYKDEESGNFIVYKNKSDGSRAVRYEGKDEAYAVNELYQKIKSEVANQKQMQAANEPVRQSSKTYGNHSNRRTFHIAIIIFIIIITMQCGIFASVFGKLFFPDIRYYQDYNSGWDSGSSWDNDSGWGGGSSWDDDSGWDSGSSWDDDWDDDWDSGSDWDSGWSDWDSDW